MNSCAARRILLVDEHAAVRHGLALVDLSPGTDDALQLVADLCARNIPVLVCSMHEEASYVRRALAAGARGYITKPEAPQELAHAVCDVLDGWTLISPRAAEGLR